MAERDRFELDLMAALRDYAADAPTEVRPTALARQFAAAHAHGPTSLGPWGLGRTPAMAWLLVLAGLLFALLVGGLIVGGWPRDLAVVPVPSPSASASPVPSATLDTSPILSLPIEMQGTWSTATTGEGSAALTLGTCAVGEDCGRLDRIDDNGEHCTYALTYGSGDATGFRLETGKGNSFGCSYSSWSSYHFFLTRAANGTITMLNGADRVLLHRVETASPSPTPDTSPILSLPIEMQGTWSTATTGEGSAALTLGTCAVGEDCGRLDRIDDNGEHCTYALTYGSGDATGFRLETGKGNSFGCAWSGWAANHVQLTRVTGGTVEILLGDHGDRIQLHRIERASPFGSASPLAMIPSELVGTWASQDGKPVVLVLQSCSIGEPCGRIERVNEDGQYCVYPLEYRDGQGAQLLAFKPPIAGNVQCYWRPMTVVVQPDGDGSVLVFWDSSFWVTEQYTLRRLDGAPAGAAPPTGG